ncbi:hypothetical protein ACFFRR_010778 [Megaselia abdita]
MLSIKIFYFSLIIGVTFCRSVIRFDDDQDTYSNIHRINEPAVFEEFEEIIEMSSLSTETPKAALKEKLSFMDMVVLLALWNKERELNRYNKGPFPDHNSVASIAN